MHPVQPRDVQFLQEARGGHVGAQHAFLDDLVRIVAGSRQDLGDLAVFAEQHARFGGLEIDGAATLAGLGQRLVQLVQVLQMR